MDKTKKNIIGIILAGFLAALCIWGPEAVTCYKDRGILNHPQTEAAQEEGAGYRFSLSSNETLYILAESLDSQSLPESEQSVLSQENGQPDYQERKGTYAFVVNRKGPSGKEITDKEIYQACNGQMRVLKDLGILPEAVRDVEASAYGAVLYSAIDVLEPRNNVTVWKLSLSDSQKNANKENRLLDAYIDADSGKIYEFYVRTPLSWEEIDTKAMIEAWSGYIGLSAPEPYDSPNPLMETTPYYSKYIFEGMGGDGTVVTIGFYEGINELFLKITK